MNYNDEGPFADSNDFEEIETKPDTDSLPRYLYRDTTKSRLSKRKKKMVRKFLIQINLKWLPRGTETLTSIKF